jgi:hypothetical protein
LEDHLHDVCYHHILSPPTSFQVTEMQMRRIGINTVRSPIKS